MKKVLKAFAFVALMVAAVAPTPALACQTCTTGSTSETTSVACTEPEDGTWGSTRCRVVCQSGDDWAMCTCDTGTGDMCYYIVVNG